VDNERMVRASWVEKTTRRCLSYGRRPNRVNGSFDGSGPCSPWWCPGGGSDRCIVFCAYVSPSSCICPLCSSCPCLAAKSNRC
jgi:hypothetical protein